jgi:hypothetical protein
MARKWDLRLQAGSGVKYLEAKLSGPDSGDRIHQDQTVMRGRRTLN